MKENPNDTNIYESNNTMKLIGKQSIIFLLEENKPMLQDILRAHPFSCTFEAMIDIFAFGVITGKRIERARRKKKMPQSTETLMSKEILSNQQ